MGGPPGARWFVLAITRMAHVCRCAESSSTFLQNIPHLLKLVEVLPYIESSLEVFCERLAASTDRLQALLPSRLPPQTVEILGSPPENAYQPLTVTHGPVMALTSPVRPPWRRQSAPVLALFDTTMDVGATVPYNGQH
jgi:hypothetical protein